jgi:hypothetical protein
LFVGGCFGIPNHRSLVNSHKRLPCQRSKGGKDAERSIAKLLFGRETRVDLNRHGGSGEPPLPLYARWRISPTDTREFGAAAERWD